MATYQQWSQSYFVNDTSRDDIVTANLTAEQHETNNEWFHNMLTMLKDDGVLSRLIIHLIYYIHSQVIFKEVNYDYYLLQTCHKIHKSRTTWQVYSIP